MAFCAKCGAETQGSFCPACGARSDASPGPSTGGGVLEDHVVSALCYLLWPLTGVLFLVLEPYKTNRAIRFHAFQSIFVAVAIFLGFEALQVLAFTPIIGLLFSLVTLVYPVAAMGLWVFLMIKAYNKERFLVPVLGSIAQSQA